MTEKLLIFQLPRWKVLKTMNVLRTKRSIVVEFLENYAQEESKICWLNYQKLKKVQAYPDGKVSEIYFKLDFEVDNRFLIPKNSAKGDGKTVLK